MCNMIGKALTQFDMLYVTGKSNIKLKWTYISVLDILGKHNLYDIYIINTYQQGSELLQT